MKRTFFVCVFQNLATVIPAKLYTRKELVMMETSITDFHTNFYIPLIQKLAFHLPHVQIIGTNNCGKTHCEAFKRRRAKKEMFCCRDYADRVIASFAHQIQSEYYGGNRSVSIEGITLENFSAPAHKETEVTLQARTHHAVLH